VASAAGMSGKGTVGGGALGALRRSALRGLGGQSK
jgi:hypothetical protein